MAVDDFNVRSAVPGASKQTRRCLLMRMLCRPCGPGLSQAGDMPWAHCLSEGLNLNAQPKVSMPSLQRPEAQRAMTELS